MKALPKALLDDLRSVEGFDEKSFIEAHQQSPVTSVRLHPLKAADVFGEAKAISWCASGRYLESRPVFTLDSLYHAGAYYVQEASSMFLDHVVRDIFPERKGLRVLDLCAAPGGKSTLLASLLDENSLLISNEVIRNRASVLEENITRWGYTNNWVTCNDPKQFAALKNYFDLIVVDAPCSGSGLFRKDGEALNNWTEGNVELCSQRQQRILADIWPVLKEDGVIIYATCSYARKEDEAILDWLGENFEAEGIDIKTEEDWGIVKTVSSGNKFPGYRFFPGKVRGEGFFLAALRKKENSGNRKPSKFKLQHDKKAIQQVSHLVQDKDWFCLPWNDGYTTILQQHSGDFQLLQQFLYFRKAGLPVGNAAGKDWIPSHEIALSVDKNRSIASVELDRENALLFLKKEHFSCDVLDKGWLLAKHQGLALGWIKSLGNRVNNYLPKHWRIRMELEQ